VSLLARTLGVLTWRSPARTARRLASFARAEEGSLIDLRIAARLTASVERAAAYLRHAADEEKHARMFASHAREWSERAGVALEHGPVDGEHLFQRLGEIGFLAFVHRAESRGRREFEAYRDDFRRRGEPRSAALFEVILEDERRHEAYSRALLVELAGSERAARMALGRALAWEAWRTWRRAGSALAGGLYAVLVALLYLAMAPLAWAMRASPERSGLVSFEVGAVPSLQGDGER
jgi:rubrerythrin